VKKRETNNAGKEYKVFLVEPPISVQEYEINNETKYTIWLPPLWAISIGTFFRKKTPRTHLKILDGQLLSFSNIKKQIIKEKPDFEDKKWFSEFYRLALKNKNPLPSFNTIVKVGSLNNLMIKKMKQININHVTFKFANKLSKFRQVDGIVASQFMPYPNTYAWKMLLSKVGDKYADTDNPDFRQIQLDWQSHFCAVGDKNLGKAANIINQLR